MPDSNYDDHPPQRTFTVVADPMDLDAEGTYWTVRVLDQDGEEVDGWELATDDNGDRDDDEATGLAARGWRRVGAFNDGDAAPVVRAS